MCSLAARSCLNDHQLMLEKHNKKYSHKSLKALIWITQFKYTPQSRPINVTDQERVVDLVTDASMKIKCKRVSLDRVLK